MGNTFSHHILTLVYREYNLYIAYFCRFEKKMCAFECIYIHVYAIYMYIVCQNFWTFVWARSLHLFLEIMQVKINDNVKKKKSIPPESPWVDPRLPWQFHFQTDPLQAPTQFAASFRVLHIVCHFLSLFLDISNTYVRQSSIYYTRYMYNLSDVLCPIGCFIISWFQLFSLKSHPMCSCLRLGFWILLVHGHVVLKICCMLTKAI